MDARAPPRSRQPDRVLSEEPPWRHCLTDAPRGSYQKQLFPALQTPVARYHLLTRTSRKIAAQRPCSTARCIVLPNSQLRRSWFQTPLGLSIGRDVYATSGVRKNCKLS